MDNQPIMKNTDISALIEMADAAALSKLQSGVTLNVVLGASECVVNTDGEKVSQVLMNLLLNACRFTQKGSITFGYEEYEDEIYFFVKDTGCGLAAEQKEKLEMLFEYDDATVCHTFGLPMANSLVKALGGKIGVESRGEGRGSTFWFTIPYTSASAGQQEEQEGAKDVIGSEVSALPDRVTILVAEDNIANMMLFERILQRKYNVLKASDGVEAVELYKQYNPDLVIMDIQMPNMDGYGAVNEIRKLSTEVPIIAVTAYAFVTDRQRLLENGFNGYVSKPININRLEQEINFCLNKE